jgi:hypothetical protein
VTPGGKPFFHINRELVATVVWDRREEGWLVQEGGMPVRLANRYHWKSAESAMRAADKWLTKKGN